MTQYLYVYVDQHGKIHQRLVQFRTLRIGERNGYDWTVVDIKVKYDNRFISLSEYERMKTLQYSKMIRKRRFSFLWRWKK